MSWYRKFSTVQSFKADVSSISPSSERKRCALYYGTLILNMAEKAAEIGSFWLNIPEKLGHSFFLSP